MTKTHQRVRSHIFTGDGSCLGDRQRVPFHHLPSVTALWCVALGLVGSDCQRLVEVGKTNMFLSRPSLSAIAVQLLAGTTLGIAHLLLMGFYPLGGSLYLLLNINRLGMEVLIYGFRLWDDGSDPISASRPA